jgi:hypothetical protein
MQTAIVVALVLSVQPILAGQPPVERKRVPPVPDSPPPLLQQYDFGGQLRTLEDPGNAPADVKAQFVTPSSSSGPIPRTTIRSPTYR